MTYLVAADCPTVPQYRYLLAADDELDDGVERACEWQDDEELRRLERVHEEQEAINEVGQDGDRRFAATEAERR